MIRHLQRLLKSRELLYMLVWRDVRIRYKQTVMGFLWALLMPCLIVGAGTLVRIGMASLSGKPVSAEDVASVVVKAVPWAFFIAAVRFGTNSLISNPNLVTKIAFPKEVFPLAAVAANFFDFLIAAVAMVIALLFMGWRPGVEALWVLPLLLVLVSFTTGLCLLLSAGNLFFRDVKYLVEVILTYAIFFTPVLYDAPMVGKWEHVLMLNPVAGILEGLAQVLVWHGQPRLGWIAYSAAVAAITLFLGYWMFKQLEEQFAERI